MYYQKESVFLEILYTINQQEYFFLFKAIVHLFQEKWFVQSNLIEFLLGKLTRQKLELDIVFMMIFEGIIQICKKTQIGFIHLIKEKVAAAREAQDFKESPLGEKIYDFLFQLL